MKNGRMQAKDVPDMPVLAFIHQVRTEGVIFHEPPGRTASFSMEGERWHHVTWFSYDGGFIPANSVQKVMPEGTPEKVVLAKMRALIRRGLVDGCPCGCRGDFELTDRGRVMLAEQGVIEAAVQTAVSDGVLSGMRNLMGMGFPGSVPCYSFSAAYALADTVDAWVEDYKTTTSSLFQEWADECAVDDVAALAVRDAGIKIERTSWGWVMHLPSGGGSIDGRVLTQALHKSPAGGAWPVGRLLQASGFAEIVDPMRVKDLLFAVARAPRAPDPHSYLRHDPSKRVTKRKRW